MHESIGEVLKGHLCAPIAAEVIEYNFVLMHIDHCIGHAFECGNTDELLLRYVLWTLVKLKVLEYLSDVIYNIILTVILIIHIVIDADEFILPRVIVALNNFKYILNHFHLYMLVKFTHHTLYIPFLLSF